MITDDVLTAFGITLLSALLICGILVWLADLVTEWMQ